MVKKIPVGKTHALVDDEDYKRISAYPWYLGSNGYAFNLNIKEDIPKEMHRLVVNARKGEVVDHINHVPLDNRRCNLSIGTHTENMFNTSKRGDAFSSVFKGVCRVKNRWHAQIKLHGLGTEIGRYLSEIEAARAYDERLRSLNMPNARFNFPLAGELAASDIVVCEDRILTDTTRMRKKKKGAQFIGVRKRDNGWIASYQIEGVETHIGRYATAVEAALVRDHAVRDVSGLVRAFNFPLKSERSAITGEIAATDAPEVPVPWVAPPVMKSKMEMVTHCPRGHPYSGVNLIVRTDRINGRACLECRRTATRECARRRRAKNLATAK